MRSRQEGDGADPVDHVRVGSVEVVELHELDLGLTRDLELAHDGQQALLKEALEGLLGLPHLAHLETLVRRGRQVETLPAAGFASSPSLAMTASYWSAASPASA